MLKSVIIRGVNIIDTERASQHRASKDLSLKMYSTPRAAQTAYTCALHPPRPATFSIRLWVRVGVRVRVGWGWGQRWGQEWGCCGGVRVRVGKGHVGLGG